MAEKDDRGESARRRRELAESRGQELAALRERLARGDVPGKDDLALAETRARQAAELAAQAHQRALEAHRHAAEAHEADAKTAERRGEGHVAQYHRRSAAEEQAAAGDEQSAG